jgi:hypothetical protein
MKKVIAGLNLLIQRIFIAHRQEWIPHFGGFIAVFFNHQAQPRFAPCAGSCSPVVDALTNAEAVLGVCALS